MRLIAFQIDSLMSWLQYHVYTIIRFVGNLNYFRPRVSTNLGRTSFKFSTPKIWETVPPGLKCLPYHKFKKEWKCCLLTNQIWPCLYVLSLILFEILFFTAANYFNVTVSNKKALATLDTVHKWTWCLLVNYYLSATLFSYLRTLI